MVLQESDVYHCTKSILERMWLLSCLLGIAIATKQLFACDTLFKTTRTNVEIFLTSIIICCRKQTASYNQSFYWFLRWKKTNSDTLLVMRVCLKQIYIRACKCDQLSFWAIAAHKLKRPMSYFQFYETKKGDWNGKMLCIYSRNLRSKFSRCAEY